MRRIIFPLLGFFLLGAGGGGGSTAESFGIKGMTDGTNVGNVSDRLKANSTVTDGTNTAAVKPASTVPAATDSALVVSLSPNGNQATAANQTTMITSLQIIDNLPHSQNASFNQGAPIMAQVDDTSPTAITEDNVGVVRMTPSRAAHVTLIDGAKPTYSAAVISLSLAANATDFFTITGSASKTIRIQRISTDFTGGGSVVRVQLVKRSTANSGGTSTTPTAVAHDSTNAAATSVVRAYTANPTLGTLVGAIRAEATNSPLLSGSNDNQVVHWDFGDNANEQQVILRGAGEVLALNFNSATLSGGVASAYVQWTEE